LSFAKRAVRIGFGFYRRAHVAPGLSVNLPRAGPRLSVGIRGAHLTIGRGGLRWATGFPGSGWFWTSRIGLHSGYHSASLSTPKTTSAQQAAADGHVERAILGALFVTVLIVCAALVGWWLAVSDELMANL
jgi:hypothetical protein